MPPAGKTPLSVEAFEKRGLRQFERTLEDLMQVDPSTGLKEYYQSVSCCSPQALYLSAVSLVREPSRKIKGEISQSISGKWYVFGERPMDTFTKRFLEYHHTPYFTVPNSGHFMMEDQPHLFYEMLLQAIRNKE